jgi:hypothetical protein
LVWGHRNDVAERSSLVDEIHDPRLHVDIPELRDSSAAEDRRFLHTLDV